MTKEYFRTRILPTLIQTRLNYPSGKTTNGLTAYVIGYVPIGEDYLDPIFVLAPKDDALIRADKKSLTPKFPVFELHNFPDMDLKWWNDSVARESIEVPS